MIKANCRDRFTHEDFSFIVKSLSKSDYKKMALSDLLTDKDCLNIILDDEELLQALLNSKELHKVSPYLYFYVLTRRAFCDAGIKDREVTDYVASMLAEFCRSRKLHTVDGGEKNYHYLVDILSDAIEAPSIEAFFLRSHLANYALFMSGVFPDYIYKKSTYGRKAPGFEYYEQMGKNSYRWASQHQLAFKYQLVEILSRLSESFRNVRIALNNLADNFISLNAPSESLDRALRQIFFGRSNNRSFEA